MYHISPHTLRSGLLLLLNLTACGPSSPPPSSTQPNASPDPVTASSAAGLTDAVELIFTTSCALAGCHSGVSPESGMSLEPARYLTDTVDQPARQLETMLRVARGEPDASYLIHKVRGTHIGVGGRGSQMPASGGLLPEASVATLEQWVLSLTLPPDADADGSADDVDCNDTDADIHPGAVDSTGNTVDEDCSGFAADVDGDGYLAISDGGTDADDDDAAIYPGAPEICGDGTDNDQDGATDETCLTDNDFDNDGFDAVSAGGNDADDDDASVYPGAPEICGDAKDNNQNGATDELCDPDADTDGDGQTPNQGDCNDSDAAISTTATEVGGNAIDEDCDGIREDRDGDGHNATLIGGDDCDDLQSSAYPGGTETADNGIDEDCNGLDATLMTFTRLKSEVLSVTTGYGCQNSSCHGSASPPQGLSLTDVNAYSNLFNVSAGQLPTMKRVKPSDPDNSYLLHKLKGTQSTVGGSGVRMPKGGPYLTEQKLVEVSNWIAHGAQNN